MHNGLTEKGKVFVPQRSLPFFCFVTQTRSRTREKIMHRNKHPLQLSVVTADRAGWICDVAVLVEHNRGKRL